MKSFLISLAALTLPLAVACGGGNGGAVGSTSADDTQGCERASDCSGFLPQSTEVCADGTTANAKWSCESHTCEIKYCDKDNEPTPAPANGSCQTAADCTGFLPRNVIGCADGTSSGAQWDCNANACVISYCDNDGGPAGSGGGSTACCEAGQGWGGLPGQTSTCNGCCAGLTQTSGIVGPGDIYYTCTTGGVDAGASNSCESATDCTGLLPRDVIACADGTSAGAQWDCNSNTCVISYCDNDGGPAGN